MKPLLYIVRKSIKNRIKELRKNPAKLILYIVIIGLIAVSMIFGTKGHNSKMKLANAEGIFIAGALAIMVFTLFSSIMTGLERGGTFFRLSDANFLFTSPIKPQKILIYGFLKQVYSSFVMIVFLLFQVPNLYNFFNIKGNGAAIVFLAMFLLTFISSILGILVYSIASKSSETRKLIKSLCYVLLGLILSGFLYNLFLYKNIGTAIIIYANSRFINYIPLLGWFKGVFAASIMGVTSAFYINLALVIAFTVLIIYCIYNISTDYYEDALSATETLEQIVAAARSGKATIHTMNKNQKLRKVKAEFKAFGAKAIFYKQILEQRKVGFLFVDKMTLIIGISSILFGYFGPGKNLIAVLGFSVYMQLIFSFQGKWAEELSKHYIYLMPVLPGAKVFYATLVDNFKNIVNGLIIFVISGLLLQDDMIAAIFAALTFASFGALFMYVDLVLRRMFRSGLSQTITVFLKFILLLIATLPGIIFAVILDSYLTNIFGAYSIYLSIISYNLLLSFLCVLFSGKLFENVEMA